MGCRCRLSELMHHDERLLAAADLIACAWHAMAAAAAPQPSPTKRKAEEEDDPVKLRDLLNDSWLPYLRVRAEACAHERPRSPPSAHKRAQDVIVREPKAKDFLGPDRGTMFPIRELTFRAVIHQPPPGSCASAQCRSACLLTASSGRPNQRGKSSFSASRPIRALPQVRVALCGPRR
jgi:hypothetical protein